MTLLSLLRSLYQWKSNSQLFIWVRQVTYHRAKNPTPPPPPMATPKVAGAWEAQAGFRFAKCELFIDDLVALGNVFLF
jgi:hypothetical protein